VFPKTGKFYLIATDMGRAGRRKELHRKEQRFFQTLENPDVVIGRREPAGYKHGDL